jgi:hypothetical protein
VRGGKVKVDNFQSAGDGRIPAYGGNLNKDELRITNSDKDAKRPQRRKRRKRGAKDDDQFGIIMCRFILKISLL